MATLEAVEEVVVAEEAAVVTVNLVAVGITPALIMNHLGEVLTTRLLEIRGGAALEVVEKRIPGVAVPHLLQMEVAIHGAVAAVGLSEVAAVVVVEDVEGE